MGSHERLDDALSKLGLIADDATDEIATLIDMYSRESTLSAVHRQLMLERFGSTDIDTRTSGPLDRTQVIAILVRMASLDAATSYTTGEIASGLGIDEAEAMDMIEQGALWSYSDGRRRHVPGWQLVLDDRDNPIRTISPHLPRVIRAIPEGAPPALVRGVMTLEDPTIPASKGNGPKSPREYLVEGGAPFPVIATLLRHLEGSETRMLEFMWGSA